jgi:tetratricopeptide (TPR) repeat protein
LHALSNGPELPQSAVDAASFVAALDAGALDACLFYMREKDARGEVDPSQDCKLAEALLVAGRHADAAECASRAFPSLGNDPVMLRICAWVFSNCGRPEDAAAAYVRLIELCPDWVEGHRHLSTELAASGRYQEAAHQAIIASDLVPLDAAYALHAAMLLVETTAPDAAVPYIDRALALADGDGRVVADAAELLIRCDRADAAAALLADIALDAKDARLLRTLSAAEMLVGRYDAALAAVERALSLAPDNAEYQLHRGHLLWHLGDVAAAASAFDRAAALAPADREVQRARLSLFLAAGLTTEAMVAGGELLHHFPDDAVAAETVLHLLNHRLSTIDGDYVVLGDGIDRPARTPRPAPGLWQRARNQRRVINALIIRETRTRFAEFKLGYGWALLEPVLHIGLLSATFAVLWRKSL